MTDSDPTSTGYPELSDRPPPAWPKVVGILSIIFGLVAILFGAGMTAMIPVFGNLIEPQLEGDPLPPNMVLTPTLIAVAVFGVLCNLLLVVAGFMTVARKPAGRTMHLVYAVLLMLATFATSFYQVRILKATEQWAAEYPNNMMAQQMSSPGQDVGQIIGIVFALALGLAWPLFCIIWFGMVKRDPDDMGDASDTIV